MNNNIKISPSLFAADIFDLRSQIEILERIDILPMPKGRGFLDTNDICLLK